MVSWYVSECFFSFFFGAQWVQQRSRDESFLTWPAVRFLSLDSSALIFFRSAGVSVLWSFFTPPRRYYNRLLSISSAASFGGTPPVPPRIRVLQRGPSPSSPCWFPLAVSFLDLPGTPAPMFRLLRVSINVFFYAYLDLFKSHVKSPHFSQRLIPFSLPDLLDNRSDM